MDDVTTIPDGLTWLEIGKKKVGIKTDLSATDVRRAESFAITSSDNDRAYARALYAVRDIDGTKFDPKSPADLNRVSDRLSASEFDLFILAYAVATRDEATEEQAKKLVEQLIPTTP